MVQVNTLNKKATAVAQEFDPQTVDYALTDPTQVSSTRVGHILKALLDYCITIPGLLLISPLLVLLALMVKLDSPGPIIHRRRVLGRNGRVFYALKFRTMHVNGDEILARYPKLKEELDQNYKLKFDPRITRVGSILRKYSLDELPQLFNVLAQDMSLIGPRIIAPDEIVKYGPYGATLLTTMPGLTGLWQVSGRSDTTYDQRVTLDMQYIHKWSIWTDIKILFRTPLVIIRGDGAY
jgi:lipopolysaccharide/colanic/teichoic acid biosynthesis glycosyltransferase